MTPAVRIFERASRIAPLGLCVWDPVAATHRVPGLAVDVFDPTQPERRVRAFENPSGVYCAIDVPGLRHFEFGVRRREDDGLPPWVGDSDEAFSAARRRYRVEINDPRGRFLPLALDADLPARGLLARPLREASPPTPWRLPTESNTPSLAAACIPLFPAPARPLPGTLAVIRAQLREVGSERPAAWALLTATVDGTPRGFGMADGEGRIILAFPYPDRTLPPRQSPPAARNDFAWTVELQAHYRPRATGAAPIVMPDLAETLSQLAHPAMLLQSTSSPPRALQPRPLSYPLPLTVCSEMPPPQRSGYLFVAAT